MINISLLWLPLQSLFTENYCHVIRIKIHISIKTLPLVRPCKKLKTFIASKTVFYEINDLISLILKVFCCVLIDVQNIPGLSFYILDGRFMTHTNCLEVEVPEGVFSVTINFTNPILSCLKSMNNFIRGSLYMKHYMKNA